MVGRKFKTTTSTIMELAGVLSLLIALCLVSLALVAMIIGLFIQHC